MKLKFIIDKNYDFEIFKEIILKNPDKVNQNITADIFDEKYNLFKTYLRKTASLYQESWDEINDRFPKTVEKITGYSWKYKTYFCVVSPFHRGISSWGGNQIIRTWQENPYTMRKITAHELLISHIFTIFEKNFQEENLSNKQKWAIAEIFTFAITGLEKQMIKFWPWIKEEEKYPLNHNYPELYSLQKELKSLYLSKENFGDFLRKAIKKVKETKI